MSDTCQYCHKPIQWERNASGKSVPVNADGTRHHRTCKAFHKAKALKARQTRELKAAYGPGKAPAEAIQDIPGQLLFQF